MPQSLFTATSAFVAGSTHRPSRPSSPSRRAARTALAFAATVFAWSRSSTRRPRDGLRLLGCSSYRTALRGDGLRLVAAVLAVLRDGLRLLGRSSCRTRSSRRRSSPSSRRTRRPSRRSSPSRLQLVPHSLFAATVFAFVAGNCRRRDGLRLLGCSSCRIALRGDGLRLRRGTALAVLRDGLRLLGEQLVPHSLFAATVFAFVAEQLAVLRDGLRLLGEQLVPHSLFAATVFAFSRSSTPAFATVFAFSVEQLVPPRSRGDRLGLRRGAALAVLRDRLRLLGRAARAAVAFAATVLAFVAEQHSPSFATVFAFSAELARAALVGLLRDDLGLPSRARRARPFLSTATGRARLLGCAAGVVRHRLGLGGVALRGAAGLLLAGLAGLREGRSGADAEDEDDRGEGLEEVLH